MKKHCDASASYWFCYKMSHAFWYNPPNAADLSEHTVAVKQSRCMFRSLQWPLPASSVQHVMIEQHYCPTNSTILLPSIFLFLLPPYVCFQLTMHLPHVSSTVCASRAGCGGVGGHIKREDNWTIIMWLLSFVTFFSWFLEQDEQGFNH